MLHGLLCVRIYAAVCGSELCWLMRPLARRLFALPAARGAKVMAVVGMLWQQCKSLLVSNGF